MKGRSSKEWHEIQIQTDGGLQRIVGYNTDKHKDASHLHNISEKISIDVKRSLADNSLFSSDWSVTSDVIWQSHAKVIDISDVLTTDAHHKSKFALHARVTIGDADFEVIPTSNGQGEIKNDIIAERKSGHISLRLFNTHVSELTSRKTYELSHMVLKQFQGTHYMHASTDLKITIITDLQINLKVEELLMKLTLSITVQEFTLVKVFQLYYLCPNFKEKIIPAHEHLKTIVFLRFNNKENSVVSVEVFLHCGVR